jgi:outer membrane protein assembly factor BamB
LLLVGLLAASLAPAASGQRSVAAAHVRLGGPQETSVNWPQWRGPLGNGVAPVSDAPVRFSAAEGVKWKSEIPGRGQSSPIVWDDLVFVTTAVPIREETEPGDRPRRRRPRLVPHDFRLIAIRRDDGSEAWSRSAALTTPHEGYHRTLSSFANPSPITDGERVYAFFGSRGLYAYGLDGEPLWSRDFDVAMEAFGQFGEASSPALHDDTLVVVFDHQQQSFIEAVDSSTGATRWKQLRDEDTSWSSPYIVEHEGRALVVTSGGNHVTAYDLGTGEALWQAQGMTPHPIPTPVAGGGLLFVASGSPERRVRAIQLGSGAATPTGNSVWELDRAAPYNPSPLLWGNELYLVRDGGLNSGTSRLSLLDAPTGEPHYVNEALPARYTVKASPVGAGDRLYLATEEGDVLVIRRGPVPEVLAVNPMGEPFIASPAIAHGELFLRGRTHLFCISGREREGAR